MPFFVLRRVWTLGIGFRPPRELEIGLLKEGVYPSRISKLWMLLEKMQGYIPSFVFSSHSSCLGTKQANNKKGQTFNVIYN